MRESNEFVVNGNFKTWDRCNELAGSPLSMWNGFVDEVEAGRFPGRT
jgi:hypothetical protein